MRSFTLVVAGSVVALAAAGAAYLKAEETRPRLSAEAGDLSAATTVEVKDAAGRVVLSGTFGAATTDDDGAAERKAPLAGDGSGEAEVEVEKRASGAPVQELEIDVKGLGAATTYTIHVDGRAAGSFTTDAAGEAEVEMSSAGGR